MNLLIYKRSEDNQQFKEIVEYSGADFEINIEYFSQLNDVVKFVKVHGNAQILIEVKTNKDLKVLTTILKKLNPYFKKKFLRVACYFNHPNDSFVTKLKKNGVAFFTEDIPTIRNLIEKLKSIEILLNRFGTTQTKKSKNKIIEFKAPLETKDDVWIIRDEGSFRNVLGKILVKLLGPGRSVLHWEQCKTMEPYVDLKCWAWKNNLKQTNLFPVNGQWLFFSDKLPPQYDTSTDQWVFTGQKMLLALKTEKEMIVKFETERDKVLICENSSFGEKNTNPIMLTILEEKNFSKEAGQIKTNEEGEGYTEQLNLDNLEGEGYASDVLDKNWSGLFETQENDSDPLKGDIHGDSDIGGFYKGNISKGNKPKGDLPKEMDLEKIDELDEIDFDDYEYDELEDSEDFIDRRNNPSGDLGGGSKTDRIQKYMGYDHDFKENDDHGPYIGKNRNFDQMGYLKGNIKERPDNDIRNTHNSEQQKWGQSQLENNVFNSSNEKNFLVRGSSISEKEDPIDIESGKLVAIVTNSDSSDKKEFECEFVDFFDDSLTLKAPNRIKMGVKDINVLLSFYYHNEVSSFKLKGTIVFQEEDANEDIVYIQINVLSYTVDKFESFIKLYEERQNNIKKYLMLTKIE